MVGRIGAEGVEDPGHGFAREDETGEKHARQDEHHRHLERLHLVLGFGPDEQTDAKKRKAINERREQQREHVSGDGHGKKKTHDGKQEDRHEHADAEIRDEFSEHESPAAQWTNEQLLEGAAFAFADHRHGGSESRPDLQDDADHTRHEKIRTAHGWVVEHLRPDLDRHRAAAAVAHHQFDGLGQGDAERGVQRLQRGGGVRAVDQHLHLRGMAGAQIAREMRRNLQSHISAPFPNLARHLIDVLDFADDPERLGVNEAIEKLPALDGAIFVQDRHRHVLDVVIERVTERDHLDERRKKHEEKRHRIAQDGDEFLEQDRVETAEGGVFHACTSFFCSRFAVRSVRATLTNPTPPTGRRLQKRLLLTPLSPVDSPPHVLP